MRRDSQKFFPSPMSPIRVCPSMHRQDQRINQRTFTPPSFNNGLKCTQQDLDHPEAVLYKEVSKLQYREEIDK